MLTQFGPIVQAKDIPVSDGGDGFIDSLYTRYKNDSNYELKSTKVLDPLDREINGPYIINKETKTAYLEVASVSGLQLLKKEERDPFMASSAVNL